MFERLKNLFREKQEMVTQDQYNSLLTKANALLVERDEVREKLEKYKTWEENPMAVLKHFIPDLDFHEIDLTALTKDELGAYLHDIYFIVNSTAFKSEMDILKHDLQEKIMLETENHQKANAMRQLHLFIEGMITRFKQLAAQYDEARKPKDREDPNRPM